MKNTLLLLLVTTALSAQVGINTTTPKAGTQLDVNGISRTLGFEMPTGATNKAVLTSDANGAATWQTPGINNVVAILGPTGINMPTTTTNYLHTGSSITLPPGKYAVNVSILIRLLNVAQSPNNSSYWIRSSFSEATGMNPALSNDIVGGKLASGSLNASSFFGLINGTIIINNTSTAPKTYYYVAGNILANGQSQIIEAFGGANTDENRIIAYKIN